MVVTAESYQVTPPLTGAGIATAVGDAFADAGLGSWYDSFLSGSIENRILEVVYDGTKTYGKTYYWFQFTATGVYVQIASGWNATTHQPTGSQWLDYVDLATNTTANHMLFKTLSSDVTFTIRRWTSGADASFSWFVVFNGTTTFNFHINRTAPIAMYDLSKVTYHSLMWCQLDATNSAASIRFRLFPLVNRRSFLGGFMRGITSTSWYGASTSGEPWNGAQSNLLYMLSGPSYHFPGNFNNQGGNLSIQETGVIVPTYFANSNTSYATDATPIITEGLLNLCSPGKLPTDFGIVANYNTNTMSPLDRFRVESGGVTQSRWDILAARNSTSTPPGSASPLFLARIE